MIDCYILTVTGEDYLRFMRAHYKLPYLVPGLSVKEETCGPGKMQFALSRNLSAEIIEMLKNLPEFVSLEPEYK